MSYPDPYNPNPYGGYGQPPQPGQYQYGQQPQEQYGQTQFYGEQSQQNLQPWMQQNYGGTTQANEPLRSVFNHWDQNKSGSIDANELTQALQQLGESVGPEDVNLMMGMFDKDKSGTIDFNEFAALYAYITDMKSAFNDSDTEGSRALDFQQVQSALGRVHGPLIAAGGAVLVYTLFKLFDKKKQSKLDWGSFLKLALRLGSLRTGFEHTPQFQQAANLPQQKPQQPAYKPQTQPYGQQAYGQQQPFGQPSYQPYQPQGQPQSGAYGGLFNNFLQYASRELGTDT